MRFRSISIAVGICASILAVYGTTPNEGLQHSRRLFENGRYSEAKSGFKDVVAQHSSSPEAPVAAYYIGLTEERRGNRTAALEAYKNMLSAYGSSSDLSSFAKQRIKEIERMPVNESSNQTASPASGSENSSRSNSAADRLARNVVGEIVDRAVPPQNETARTSSGSRRARTRTASRTRRNERPQNVSSGSWPRNQNSTVSSATEYPQSNEEVNFVGNATFPENFLNENKILEPSANQHVVPYFVGGIKVVTFPVREEILPAEISEISSNENEEVVEQTVEAQTPNRPSLQMTAIPVSTSGTPLSLAGSRVSYERRQTSEDRTIGFDLSGGKETSTQTNPPYYGTGHVSTEFPSSSAGANREPLIQNTPSVIITPQTRNEEAPWWAGIESRSAERSIILPVKVPSPSLVFGTDITLSARANGDALEKGRKSIPKIEVNAALISLIGSAIETLEASEEKEEEVKVEVPAETVVEEVKVEVPAETVVEKTPAQIAKEEKPELRGLDAVTSISLTPISITEREGSIENNGAGKIPSFELAPLPISVPATMQPVVSIQPPAYEVEAPSALETPIPFMDVTGMMISAAPIETSNQEHLQKPVSTSVINSANEDTRLAASTSELPAPQYSISIDPLRRAVISELGGQSGQPFENIQRPISAVPETSRRLSSANEFILKALEYRKLNLLDKAVEEYLKALEADPNNPIVKNNLADIYVEKNEKIDEAISMVTEALQTDISDRGPYYSTLGWAYARSGDLVNAEKFLTESLKTGVTAGRLYRRAMVYAAMGLAARARADLDKALVYSEDAATTESIRQAYEEIEKNLPIQGTSRNIR